MSDYYLTIRLLALDFYEVIVDMKEKRESSITSYKPRASNLIVLVESESKYKMLHKNIEKSHLKKNAPVKYVFC